MVGWFWVLCIMPLAVLFFTKFFNPWYLLAGTVYCMVVMGTHGTIWYHRYCTHRAYKFSNRVWKFITQNLVIKVIPEEIYVVSHHVHHTKSDQPGDPYNPAAGFWYCFLADTNHQSISKVLDEDDYLRTTTFLKHTGIRINSYKQYLKWGSIAHPLKTFILWIANWSFWYTAFFLIGGHGLACALFTGAMIWVVGVRTFNYTGHGGGENKHKEGLDYNDKDLSINQSRPGMLTGEWHNNHHLFPGSARSGFLKGQIDFAWYYIYLMHKIGAVVSYTDSKKQFMEQYYHPYQNSKKKTSSVPEKEIQTF